MEPVEPTSYELCYDIVLDVISEISAEHMLPVFSETVEASPVTLYGMARRPYPKPYRRPTFHEITSQYQSIHDDIARGCLAVSRNGVFLAVDDQVIIHEHTRVPCFGIVQARRVQNRQPFMLVKSPRSEVNGCWIPASFLSFLPRKRQRQHEVLSQAASRSGVVRALFGDPNGRSPRPHAQLAQGFTTER